MDNLFLRFQASVKQQGLFNAGDKLLIAVSGGLDSMVLADCCDRAGYDTTLAHANFHLRGAESDRDEAFVRAWATARQRPLRVGQFDARAQAGRQAVSIQVAARDLRYAWFESLMDAEQYRYVLTAHHVDDNLETMLMHFFRGTGIAGMRGMQPKQGRIIRPLLGFRRSELEAYATAQSLSWVEDSSNASEKYTRNYFRHRLIPDIEQVFPEVRHNLEGNLQRFAETEILYHQALAQHKKRLMKTVGAEVHLPVLLLKKSDPVRSILFEILRPYGFSSAQLDDALRLLDAENGKFIASASHRLIRNRAWLIIAPAAGNTAAHHLIEAGQARVDFDGASLLLQTIPVNGKTEIAPDPAVAMLDAEKIEFPLILRRWKAGDYFYPLGMKKKKKLARFLIDLKLSKTAKEKVWVLESGQHVLWVVGHRIDNRFAISPGTKKILKIEMRVLQLV